MADARMVRPVAEFDLSSAVAASSLVSPLSLAQQQRLAFAPSLDGVTAHPTCESSALTHLTRRARIVRRAKQDTCSCKQCENLVAPLSGGAALEEAAAWEAKQMENARHAKEPLPAEVERLSAARAKGKKGKKKTKNVGVGDTGAAGLNEEMLSCS
ncbi:hypothetical protein EMIHUDRAFT_200426 [Emiliania huxleyi CCMP1516]|uniref:Uncharacterized protein n=2 Tax=Emiliania huxleyi TaxID=2903 RepID=A0A0D3KQJ9_EMIH1|nr:hypothetical protein EMIHUDRAFT_200426 [Emiliania huxleyi CCMP1516]EOD38034.1 hypothetical protein EMIHUDRAFT_200426 [Emiliania huxleyi CCMP1516]|eukprot:XP_005790463.1 hypothetical protein EMIHUDRAFT_200426 [Emiliania huxleyi CCMP1516]